MPTSDDDLAGGDLIAVASRVVIPAVRAVFASDEVDALSLAMRRDEALGQWSVEVELSVEGESYYDVVYDSRFGSTDQAEWLERLRSNLEDFVAESSFGWGQDRRNGPSGQ